MRKIVKSKRASVVTVGIRILTFLLAFLVGVVSKIVIKPSWTKEYSVSWSDELGTLTTDLSYGEEEANKFDLYLPKDNSRESYGLVAYFHAGGFTSGDKRDDRGILSWLCSKGYVAAGINYSLRTNENDVSILSESNEIKDAIPVVVKEAEKAGYHIDRMASAGGSAGHALAMIYAYRDGADAPVPVVLTFGAVGPSSFHREDWGIFGLDQNDEVCAIFLSLTAGVEITVRDVQDDAYLEKVKPISAVEWINDNPVPSVVAYGAFDKLQPYRGALRLKAALEETQTDFEFYVASHSGHGLQNDSTVYRRWLKAVERYLDKYMPVK